MTVAIAFFGVWPHHLTMRLAILLSVIWLGLVATSAARSAARPELYVYQGAGCTGLAQLPQFEALVGRPVDGIVDFNDYSRTARDAVANLDWQLGCWAHHVPNVAISIGLAFKDATTAQIAAGAQDGVFVAMGKSLVAHGFRRAYIRLGWEENGGWYAWGRTGRSFASAFDRAARLLKATPHNQFTIFFNPAAGMQMDQELPTAQDGVALDVYANSWNSGGAITEPGLWDGNLNGWWGIKTLGAWPRSGLPTAVPEFGVGSRGDGHGACPNKSASGCDDPYYMTKALAYFMAIGTRFVGYWDYNAGDYNSRISDGSRPQQAAAFVSVFGAPAMQALFHNTGGSFAPATPPRLSCDGCEAVAHQVGPKAWVVVMWNVKQDRLVIRWPGMVNTVRLYEVGGGTPKLERQVANASSIDVQAAKRSRHALLLVE